MMNQDDTIFALATGPGRGAIAVLRISGLMTQNIVMMMTGILPQPRLARLTHFKHPASKEPLDQGLLLWFPAPKSFTGEDCAEFHVHAGQAIIAAFFEAFRAFPNLRLAEPGEFSRRAFFHGKMDLTQAEALGDLIAAETEAQRRQSFRQMEGTLSKQASLWRDQLLEASALVEGAIDFSEEPDVPKLALEKIDRLVSSIIEGIDRELAASQSGMRIRDGLTIVLMGPPNAGKSSLLNALARRDIAIVSPIPGTTRDAIEIDLDLKGFAVSLIDTAGLRESFDAIERIGMERTREKAAKADLILWLSAVSNPIPPLGDVAGEIWPVFTKADLASDEQKHLCESAGGLIVSVHEEATLSRLLDKLETYADGFLSGGSTGLITRERHLRAFTDARTALLSARNGLNGPVEFLAEDLRLAIRALQRLSGAIDAEDVLGEIFARFCVGK